MHQAQCLCGSVRWQYSGKPEWGHHCHCTMCRKAHGAAFGSYYGVDAKNFQWLGDTDTISHYRSSDTLTRDFCHQCGSVVPVYSDDGQSVFIPAGNHDTGYAIDSHIFVASKAPWYDITDKLPQSDEYEPDDPLSKSYNHQSSAPPTDHGIRGSCLCDAINFVVREPFKVIHNCFCSRCPKARSADHTTNGFTSDEGVIFTKGEHLVTLYKVPDAQFFTHAFCSQCGSGMPRIDNQRHLAIVPIGALDDDPGSRAVDNLYSGNKPEWFEITGPLPTFEEGPA